MSGNADWSQRYGAQCPACGVYTKTAYKHGEWEPGYKVRYHKCPGCGTNFKSVADDPAGREVEPTPEQLRFLRGYECREGVRRGGIKVPKGWLGLPGMV
jgi:hypothetical protein